MCSVTLEKQNLLLVFTTIFRIYFYIKICSGFMEKWKLPIRETIQVDWSMVLKSGGCQGRQVKTCCQSMRCNDKT